jgi:hypothetical protein
VLFMRAQYLSFTMYTPTPPGLLLLLRRQRRRGGPVAPQRC